MQNDLTRKMNRKLVTHNMKVLFDMLGRPFPKHIIYVRSPYEAQCVANYLDQGDFNTLIKTHNYTNNYNWTSEAVKYCKQNKIQMKYFDDSNLILRGAILMYSFKDAPDVTKKRITAGNIILKYTPAIYLFNEVVIISHNPTKVTMDDNGKLTFIKFTDGYVADLK